MHGYIERMIEGRVKKALDNFPVVAILGARQTGKSTLARELVKGYESQFLDLQSRQDLNRLIC